MVEVTKTVYVDSRAKWRRWLEKNHDRVAEIWLLYAKKSSGKKRVSYSDAVEEALCFGWIDGVLKPVDENFYAQRFSPRRAGSKWSALNRGRYARLLREGKVAKAGLERQPDPGGAPRTPAEFGDKFPANIRKALRADELAWTNFRELSPSQRRMFVFWINVAKKEETRQKRIREAIKHLRNKATLHAWMRKK